MHPVSRLGGRSSQGGTAFLAAADVAAGVLSATAQLRPAPIPRQERAEREREREQPAPKILEKGRHADRPAFF